MVFHFSGATFRASDAFVAAGDIDARVKRRCAGMNLDHAGDHFPARQAEIDAVRPLALSVADIRAEVARAKTALLRDAPAGRLDQPVQMAAARMAVAEGALNHDLRLDKVLALPARADPQGIQLRRQAAHSLTRQFHPHPPFLSP